MNALRKVRGILPVFKEANVDRETLSDWILLKLKFYGWEGYRLSAYPHLTAAAKGIVCFALDRISHEKLKQAMDGAIFEYRVQLKASEPKLFRRETLQNYLNDNFKNRPLLQPQARGSRTTYVLLADKERIEAKKARFAAIKYHEGLPLRLVHCYDIDTSVLCEKNAEFEIKIECDSRFHPLSFVKQLNEASVAGGHFELLSVERTRQGALAVEHCLRERDVTLDAVLKKVNEIEKIVFNEEK